MSSPSGCNRPASVSSTFSKGLIKAGLHPAQEGNDRPQSPRRLPFISIFLSKTRGWRGRGGERSWRKNKNSSPCAPGFGGGRAARAGSGARLQLSKRGAAAPSSGRAERRTRLLGPGRGPHTGSRRAALPSLGLRDKAVIGWRGWWPSVGCTPKPLHLRTSWPGDWRTDSSPGAPSSANPQAVDTPHAFPPVLTPGPILAQGCWKASPQRPAGLQPSLPTQKDPWGHRAVRPSWDG